MNRLPESELMKEVWNLAAKFNDLDIGNKDAPKIEELIDNISLEELMEREGGGEAKYPPENDAEAVEFVRHCFACALSYCIKQIEGYIEEYDEENTEE